MLVEVNACKISIVMLIFLLFWAKNLEEESLSGVGKRLGLRKASPSIVEESQS